MVNLYSNSFNGYLQMLKITISQGGSMTRYIISSDKYKSYLIRKVMNTLITSDSIKREIYWSIDSINKDFKSFKAAKEYINNKSRA